MEPVRALPFKPEIEPKDHHQDANITNSSLFLSFSSKFALSVPALLALPCHLPPILIKLTQASSVVKLVEMIKLLHVFSKIQYLLFSLSTICASLSTPWISYTSHRLLLKN